MLVGECKERKIKYRLKYDREVEWQSGEVKLKDGKKRYQRILSEN